MIPTKVGTQKCLSNDQCSRTALLQLVNRRTVRVNVNFVGVVSNALSCVTGRETGNSSLFMQPNDLFHTLQISH